MNIFLKKIFEAGTRLKAMEFNSGVWPRFSSDFRSIVIWTAALLVFAYLGVFGLSNQVVSNLLGPISTSGDAIGHQALIVRLRDGGFFENQRLGYPFGSQFYDYPISDLGNLAFLKLFLFLGASTTFAANVYYFFGFILAFLSSQILFRSFNIRSQFANVLAFLFSLSFFHFSRFNHLFLTWYWVLPVYIYIGFLVVKGNFPSIKKLVTPRNLFLSILCFALPSFGIYFAVFGILSVIWMTAVAALISPNRKLLTSLATFLMLQSVSIVVNLAPSIFFILAHGRNYEVATRVATESDLAGFHPLQLFIPRPDHLYLRWANFSQIYNQQPFVNENQTSTVGAIASIGVVITILYFVVSSFRNSFRNLDLQIGSSILVFALVLGTSGGLGSLIAYILSPQIRSWNRISIEIALIGFVCFGLILSAICWGGKNSKNFLSWLAIILIAGAGVADQVPMNNPISKQSASELSRAEQTFIESIENELPENSAIFQMPYMSYPEAPPINSMADYSHLVGFNNSVTLSWSYGSMKGREADAFFRELTSRPVNMQFEGARRMGFAGVYIDRRGYTLEDDILNKIAESRLFKDGISDQSGERWFFEFISPQTVDYGGLTLEEKVDKANKLLAE